MALLGNTIGLLYEIRGDTSGAEKSLSAFSATVDKDVKKMEGSFDSFAGTAGLFAGVLTTVAAGAATATAALFNLTKQASDFGSEIYDASQKTGLSAESLSALKLAADESGSSLEQVSGSVTKFSKLIGDAAAGSKEAAEKLKRLGLDPQDALQDLDGALATVFKRIAEAQNPIVATKLATDAFGKSGADIIPVIKSFDGNMEGLIKRAKELGVVINDETAAAADEFGDTMDDVGKQVEGLKVTIGNEFMPVFLDAMRSVSEWLKENKGTVHDWAQGASDAIRGVGLAWTEARAEVARYVQFIQDHPFLAAAVGGSLGASVATSEQNGQAIADAIIALSPAATIYEQFRKAGKKDRESMVRGGAEFKGYLGDLDVNKEADASAERRKSMQKQLQDLGELNRIAIDRQRMTFEEVQSEWDNALKNNTTSFEDYKKNTLSNLDVFAVNVRDLLRQAFDLEVKDKSGAEKSVATEKYNNALQKFNAEVLKQQTEINDRASDAAQKSADEQVKITENKVKRQIDLEKAGYERAIAEQQRAIEAGGMSPAEQEAAAVRLAELKRGLLDLELKEYKYLFAAQKEGTDAYEDAWNRLQVALEKHKIALGEINEQLTTAGDTVNQMQRDPGEPGTPPPTESGTQGGWLPALLGGAGLGDIEEKFSLMAELGNMLSATFQQVAQSVGEAVRAFVLFGSTGGSFRKFAAEVIASVAQMAAVQAIFELAQGFAMSALAWFTGNPKYAASATQHYIAAGVFGAIAGVAAVAGRAVAGNAFQNQTNAATGSTSSSGGGQSQGGAYSGQADQTINQSRNAPAGALANPTLTLKVDDRSGWFAKMFKMEWDKNTDGFRSYVMDDLARA